VAPPPGSPRCWSLHYGSDQVGVPKRITAPRSGLGVVLCSSGGVGATQRADSDLPPRGPRRQNAAASSASTASGVGVSLHPGYGGASFHGGVEDHPRVRTRSCSAFAEASVPDHELGRSRAGMRRSRPRTLARSNQPGRRRRPVPRTRAWRSRRSHKPAMGQPSAARRFPGGAGPSRCRRTARPVRAVPARPRG
jgi:hypothetical protein